jgi:meiotic recombination protein SPO11
LCFLIFFNSRVPLEQCRLDMTESDIKTGKELLKEEFIMKNKEWTKKKAEIQALSSFGFQYVTEVYLPKKLREGDWI